MAHVDRVLQIEVSYHRRQVVGVVIHIMAFADLAGPTMSPAIMGDHAITLAEEKQHLRVPIIGRKRPAMAEDDGVALPPVFVEDFDSVLRRDHWHGILSYVTRLTSAVSQNSAIKPL